MKDVLYITGHKNPDSDSICAAIAYAYFKNKIGISSATAARLGDVNRETKFILDYFGVNEPTLIETVKLQVSDLHIDNIAPISKDISVKMAWTIMKKNDVKTLPVTDENNNLLGLVSLSNLTSTYMDIWDNHILGKSCTTLENILDTLSGEIIYSTDSPSFTGKIVVSAMHPDSLKGIIEEGDIAICGDREDAQSLLINSKASLIIVTGKHSLSDELIDKAKKNNCTIISTPYDSFITSKLITQSIPVGYIMTTDNLVSFSTEDFVDEIKSVMLETRYRSYPIVNESNKVMGSISRYHLMTQDKKKVILVDHNERGQSVHGLEDAEILEIIDHHRIADVQTGNPIYFRNEPVGSTSTIVSSIFFENGIIPSKKIAGILCAAIISDTLLFRSPTCTQVDKIMANRLSNIAGIDIDNFAKEMFKAGTSLSGRTPSQIFNQDFKVFNIDNIKIGVSQINTMDIEGFQSLKDDILNLMEDYAKENNFRILVFMLTDILKEGSEILAVGPDKDIVSKTFNVDFETTNSAFLPGVLSRKKQIIPPITATIASLD